MFKHFISIDTFVNPVYTWREPQIYKIGALFLLFDLCYSYQTPMPTTNTVRTRLSKSSVQRTKKLMENMEHRLHRIRSSMNQTHVDQGGPYTMCSSKAHTSSTNANMTTDEAMAMAIPSLSVSSGDNNSSYIYTTFTDEEAPFIHNHNEPTTTSPLTQEQDEWMQSRMRRLLVDGKQASYAILVKQQQQQHTLDDFFQEENVQAERIQRITERRRLLQKFGF